uniref:Protein kinase domain-containing protein n=1 Tax=Macrostomum lignano TaxID=282301 RepID=A0A1I8G820_9PLAT
MQTTSLSYHRENTPGENTTDSKKNVQKKKTGAKKGNKANDLKANADVPKEEEANAGQSAPKESQIILFDGDFDLSHLTRDFWLDQRRCVQNGSRHIRCDSHCVRYMCTSRSLRDWQEEEIKTILENFKRIIKAQRDLASLTPFVQKVLAAKVYRHDLLVITPLPSNMYLSDLKKLMVHLTHSTVRYYAACILLALEFLHHRRIYHGNLSLTSIALDHYGRPQVTDLDTLLFETIGEMSYQLDVLRYAALLGVLHCDNLRHFSVSHMRSTSLDDRRRDVFSGVCPKCRLTAECMEPKLCNCNDFGSLVRHIKGKVINKDSMRRILDTLQCTWIEADLRYSWSRIPKKQSALGSSTGPSQLQYSDDAYDDIDEDFDEDIDWPMRQSHISLCTSSTPQNTETTGTKSDSSNPSIVIDLTSKKKHQNMQRQKELQSQGSQLLSEPSQSVKLSNLNCMGVSYKSVLGKSSSDAALEPSQNKNAEPKLVSRSASVPELPKVHRSKRQTSIESLNATPKVFPSTKNSSFDQKSKPLPPESSPTMSAQQQWVDLSDEESRVETNTSTDKKPQSSSSSTLWQGLFTAASNSSVSVSEHTGCVFDAGHNQSASNLSSAKEQNQKKPPTAPPANPTQLPASSMDQGKPATINAKSDHHQFKFSDYQQMMRHGINWITLEAAQPPEGFWFATGLIMQDYAQDAAPLRTGDNAGGETDQLAGSYFTSRSRLLYNMFG